MNDDNQLYNLSRRKLLGGIGAIGFASAGAGLGTSAYFNDTETFSNNSLTAGELDLSVGYEFVGSDAFHADGLPANGVLNGDTLTFAVDDVKPGDWAAVCLTISIDDNPSYVRVLGDLTEDAENTVPEPENNESNGNENNADPSATSFPLAGPFPEGDGELAEEVLVTVGTGYTPGQNGAKGTIDGVAASGIPADSTLREVMGLLADPGYTLRGPDGYGDGNANATAVGNTTLHPDADVNDVQFCFLFELPASVGNWVQTDSVGFDLTFEAIQTRHNDGADPFAALNNTSGN